MRTPQPLRLFRCLAVLAGCGLLFASMNAVGDEPPFWLTLDGYGTLGLVHSSEERADFVGNVTQREGAGHSASWSSVVDSRLGLQLRAEFTPRLTGVLQVVSEQQYDGSFRPQVEWANLSYRVTPDLDLRVGRTVLKSFMLSDSRKVGFALPWVRPPTELYGMVPVTSTDGVDLNYRLQTGAVNHTLQAHYGGTSFRLVDGSSVEADSTWGLTHDMAIGSASFHLAYQRSRLTIEAFNDLFDGFRQFGPPGVAIADRFDVADSTVPFFGVGAAYDPGRWFVRAEWGRFNSRTVLGKREAWYASAGYRVGRWTPYVMHADSRAVDPQKDPGLDPANYPPQLTPTVLGLNAALQQTLALTPVQSTSSIGLRWDLRDSAAIKLQYDHTRLGEGSVGGLINPQPGFEPGGDFGLVSITFDFVF